MRQEGPSYFRLYARHHDAALAALRVQRGHLRTPTLIEAFEDEGWRVHQRRSSGDLDALLAIDGVRDPQDARLFLEAIAPFVKPGSYVSLVINGQPERWSFDGVTVTVAPLTVAAGTPGTPA